MTFKQQYILTSRWLSKTTIAKFPKGTVIDGESNKWILGPTKPKLTEDSPTSYFSPPLWPPCCLMCGSFMKGWRLVSLQWTLWIPWTGWTEIQVWVAHRQATRQRLHWGIQKIQKHLHETFQYSYNYSYFFKNKLIFETSSM